MSGHFIGTGLFYPDVKICIALVSKINSNHFSLISKGICVLITFFLFVCLNFKHSLILQ